MWLNTLLVFLGGGLGSVLRYFLGFYFNSSSCWIPLGTLLANLLACFTLGYLAGLGTKNMVSPSHSLLIGAGFCGGFSTFSTFSKESLSLLQKENLSWGFFYLGASLLLGLVFVRLGIFSADFFH